MIAVAILLLLFSGILTFMTQPQFGKRPAGKDLERIKNSPNYRDGKFQNIHFTPDLEEGVSYPKVLRKFFFGKSKRTRPSIPLPSVKTNLHTIPADKNVLVWFGHSSYFLQLDGKKILVDPVFSGSASPVKFTTKSFPGSDVYTVDDMPEIDYLFISHDHWDHLDFETVLKLKPKVKKVITGLGVAVHFERWKYDKDKVIEKDWDQEIVLEPGFVVNIKSGRHFSGRTLKRNKSLWSSFVLATPTKKIFLGGDSGYDTHFKNIGEAFGPFDLALLECGQYNQYWKYIHMMPEETVQAAIDLGAKTFIPVHWAKFSLALHDWDDPIKRVVAESAIRQIPIVTPMIGEAVDLDHMPLPVNWWKNVN